MADSDGSSSSRPRPGGRSARVVAAAHAAALEVLRDVGYDGLQLADVAKRAEVNKTTVYRRWPTKAALVGDLMAQFTRSAVATPDTGALQSDLELLLTEIADALEDRAVRAVLYAALAAGDSNDDIVAALTGFWAERFARSGEIVERACLRGELPVGVDPRTFLEMASGPIYFRALFSDDDVDRRFIEEVAARIVRGYRAD